MKLMKTAEEMMQFCVDNNTGFYSVKYLNHFKVIEDCLQTDEYAVLCLEGTQIIDLDFRSTRDERYSLALTNKRLVMGQKSDMGEDLQIVWYKDLNGIEVVNRSLLVDTVKNVPCMMISSEDVSYIQKKTTEIMSELKRKKTVTKAIEENSSADEIRKFKELCDDGIITEEEFQKKKEQLLNRDDAFEYTEIGTGIVIDINPADYMPIDGDVVKDNAAKWSIEGMVTDNGRAIATGITIGIFCVLGFVVYFLQHL